jgi:BlaI family transcriptional regulator, penicillinase repressor
MQSAKSIKNLVDFDFDWQYIATGNWLTLLVWELLMAKRKGPQELGRRERQIMDAVYQLGEASVADVLSRLPDPPSYSAVRTMIRLLERKGYLRHRKAGTKYVYRPTEPHESASRSAIGHLLDTFFGGSASDAMAALLDVSSKRLSDADYRQMQQLIEQARKEGR